MEPVREVMDSTTGIAIHLNGERQTIPRDLSVTALLARLELVGQRLAVELNREIVPRSEHDRRVLQDGDRVEIVHAIGGG